MLRSRSSRLIAHLLQSPAASASQPSAPTPFRHLHHAVSRGGQETACTSGLAALALYQRTAGRSLLCSSTAASAMAWNSSSAQPVHWNLGFLWRQFSAQPKPKEEPQEKKVDSLEITEESYKAITDQIPQRPMGVVEGTSYSLIIVAAFAFLAFIVYQFVVTLLLEPLPYQCYNTAFDRLKEDPRITVRLGGDVRAWGAGGGSRASRQQIPHTIYKTEDGTEHVRLQFHMGGSAGVGLVSADMFKGPDGTWQYLYLVVDVASQGSQQAQRLFIVTP